MVFVRGRRHFRTRGGHHVDCVISRRIDSPGRRGLWQFVRVMREWLPVYIGLMSQRPASPSVQSIEALRQQMERSIDELAELARTGIESGKFFAEVLLRALNPGGACYGIVWRMLVDGTWEFAGDLPVSGHHADVTQRLSTLNELANSSQLRIIQSARGEHSHGELHVFSPLCHAGRTVGILETHHRVDSGTSLPAVADQFFAAIGEITADYLSQQELQHLQQSRIQWQQWDHFGEQLGQSLNLDDVCSVIANDGRPLVGCDRISVLVRTGRHYRLCKTSGVERANPRAGAVRSLEQLAVQIEADGKAFWESLSPADALDHRSVNDRLKESLVRYAQESSAVSLGAIPLFPRGQDSAGCRPVAMFMFECFQPHEQWSGLQPVGESLVRRSANMLRAAIERDAIPFLNAWNRIQRGPQFVRRPATLITCAIAFLVVLGLILIPAEFTVTGNGELWPDRRRDIFATTTGIIDQILVEHGDSVLVDQPLIILRDPQLEQEIPRITGEIATVLERLKGVQATRLSGAGSSDSTIKGRQLTADEEELKERLKTLELHSRLLEERKAALTLRSPIAGKVLTWNVAQHLSARPVDRGQSLLTVGETEGQWIIEIRVADKDAGPVLRARAVRRNLDVDFLVVAEPGRTRRGQVRDVSLSVESDDQMKGFVRVIAEFDRAQVEQLRPGATAIPRIHCGPKSLGYVWLHDLIDAIRTRLWF